MLNILLEEKFLLTSENIARGLNDIARANVCKVICIDMLLCLAGE